MTLSRDIDITQVFQKHLMSENFSVYTLSLA